MDSKALLSCLVGRERAPFAVERDKARSVKEEEEMRMAEFGVDKNFQFGC